MPHRIPYVIALFLLPMVLGCPAEVFINDHQTGSNDERPMDDDDLVDDDDDVDDDDAGERYYEFVLFDSWRDGWGESRLEIRDGDGTLIETLSLRDGLSEGSFTVVSPNCIDTTFVDAGGWADECSYEVLDEEGDQLFFGYGRYEGPAPFTDCE